MFVRVIYVWSDTTTYFVYTCYPTLSMVSQHTENIYTAVTNINIYHILIIVHTYSTQDVPSSVKQSATMIGMDYLKNICACRLFRMTALNGVMVGDIYHIGFIVSHKSE